MENKYYVQRFPKSDIVQFWKIGDFGYSDMLSESRLFTKDELIKNNILRGDGKYVVWPEEVLVGHDLLPVTLAFLKSKCHYSISDVKELIDHKI